MSHRVTIKELQDRLDLMKRQRDEARRKLVALQAKSPRKGALLWRSPKALLWALKRLVQA